MDGKEFRYYYDDGCLRGEPLCSIPLRYVYAVLPLEDTEYNKLYSFQLSVTGWQKKEREMNERKFYFAAEDEEGLESWMIYIEFAKAKAVYDGFVNSFGKVQFPIGSSTDGYCQF